jgi:hypothetical protein
MHVFSLNSPGRSLDFGVKVNKFGRDYDPKWRMPYLLDYHQGPIHCAFQTQGDYSFLVE